MIFLKSIIWKLGVNSLKLILGIIQIFAKLIQDLIRQKQLFISE